MGRYYLGETCIKDFIHGPTHQLVMREDRTLHSNEYLLLAVGQTLPAGIPNRWVTNKGFRFQFTSVSSSFAKLLGAIPLLVPQSPADMGAAVKRAIEKA